MSEQFLDCVGVPEFFVTHIGAIEDAGSGMVRTIRCIKRSGVLIPIVSCIVPALAMLEAQAIIKEIARKAACGDCIAH